MSTPDDRLPRFPHPDAIKRPGLGKAADVFKHPPPAIRLGPRTLQHPVRFTPRRIYADVGAYLELWSPWLVDPAASLPPARFSAGYGGGIHVSFRTAAEATYVVECACEGVERMRESIAIGENENSTLVQTVEGDRFSHAFGPRPEGSEVSMMFSSPTAWTWSECTITPTRS